MLLNWATLMCFELSNQSYIVMVKVKWPRLYCLVMFFTHRLPSKIGPNVMFGEWCMKRIYRLVYVPSLTNALLQMMNCKHLSRNKNHSFCSRPMTWTKFMHMCPIVNVSPNSNFSRITMKKRRACRLTMMSLHDNHPTLMIVKRVI